MTSGEIKKQKLDKVENFLFFDLNLTSSRLHDLTFKGYQIIHLLYEKLLKSHPAFKNETIFCNVMVSLLLKSKYI